MILRNALHTIDLARAAGISVQQVRNVEKASSDIHKGHRHCFYCKKRDSANFALDSGKLI